MDRNGGTIDMKIKRIITGARAVLGCAALALSAPAALAQGEAYPARPITILVPFAPGGSSDTIRPIAQKAGEILNATIVIDHRVGAGGNVAALATKQAAPDGYTLFLANNGTLAINTALFPDLRFDPVKDFQAITKLMSFPSVLAVPADLPARNVKELVELGKSRPNGLTYASQGIGSGGHILGEMFRLKTGATLVHVPYRGAGPAVIDLTSGRTDLLFTSYMSAAGQIENGKIRVLGYTSLQRTPVLPNVPTMAEAGFPGTELEIWHGLVAPAGTPEPIVRKLHAAFVQAAKDPAIVKIVEPQAASIATNSPEAFAKEIADDVKNLGKVVRDADIKVK